MGGVEDVMRSGGVFDEWGGIRVGDEWVFGWGRRRDEGAPPPGPLITSTGGAGWAAGSSSPASLSLALRGCEQAARVCEQALRRGCVNTRPGCVNRRQGCEQATRVCEQATRVCEQAARV